MNLLSPPLLLGVDIPVSIVSTLLVCTGIPGLFGY